MTLLGPGIRDHASHGGTCGPGGDGRKSETEDSEDSEDSAGIGSKEEAAMVVVSVINAHLEIEAENQGHLGYILGRQRLSSEIQGG